jgi:nucleolar GTP-binding protein
LFVQPALCSRPQVPLGRWINGFPKPGSLHPFEVALLELTLGDDRYEKTIRRVNDLRKRLLEVGKGYAARVGKASTKFDVMQLR